MSDENKKNEARVQANNNSVAVESISVEGNFTGNFHIGNINGITPEEATRLFETLLSKVGQKEFDGTCPYKGLDVFEEQDAELFFGREKLVEQLISRVKSSRTVFITGPSGSGKSSLVRAGLIHVLKQGAIQESHSEHWLYTSMKPGRDPVDALGNALSRLRSPEIGKYLRENAGQAGTLHECAESVLSDQKEQRLVLFVDQFEEVFTQVNQSTEREKFLDLLTYTSSKEDGRVVILFAMRSDFIVNCAAYPRLNELLGQQFIQVAGMQSDELVSAIARPALQVGLPIKPELVAQIINEMQGQEGALPLMQFALKDLFDSEKEKGGVIALTVEGYLQRGGIHKALERHADATLMMLDEKEKELARSIFSGLIEVERGTQVTRRTALLNELVPVNEKIEAIQAIVQKLADARLVTTDEQSVTISHEKLIDAWPWLKKLVHESRDTIALQNEVAEHAREWDEHKQDASYLYIGARLANAREKLETRKLILGNMAQQFIKKSMEAEKSKHLAEERRLQKELEDARKLTQAAQAQAKAERSRLLIGGFAVILAIILLYNPIQSEIWRQLAKRTTSVEFASPKAKLGDPRQSKDDPFIVYPEDVYELAPFAIDAVQVTNRRYELCVRVGICGKPLSSQKIYNIKLNAEDVVVNITAIDAQSFCEWIGQRLPTDKEWELAARSGKLTSAGEIWEWTNTPFDWNIPEWTDTSQEPPEGLTIKGGLPGHPLEENVAYRLNQGALDPNTSTGFRCATDL